MISAGVRNVQFLCRSSARRNCSACSGVRTCGCGRGCGLGVKLKSDCGGLIKFLKSGAFGTSDGVVLLVMVRLSGAEKKIDCPRFIFCAGASDAMPAAKTAM